MGRRVAERARMMAESADVPLHLLHVLEPVAEAMIEPSIARLMREFQREEAAKLADWVKERAEVPVDLEVVKGSPSWELTARGKSAGRVVVGSSSIDAFSVGPVQLAGTSPQLQASYSVTCYIYPLAKGGDTVPMAGGGAAPGTPGAAPM